jgi:hypothetical protein
MAGQPRIADLDGTQGVQRQWKDGRHERRTDSFPRTSFKELADIRRCFACDGPGETRPSSRARP